MAVAARAAPIPGPAPALLDWRWALPRIALVFLATRLLVLGMALAVEATQPPPPAGVRVDERPILASLTAWDGRYYLSIAQDGYHAEPVYGPFVDYAFFPLYPLVVEVASVLTLGDTALAAVLVANTAFALALGALFALSVRYLSPERSIRALWYLALAPGAVAFALAYSDSLFLLLAVAAFLAAETRHARLAGLAYALATLARPPGILLGLPLLVLYVQRDGRRPSLAWLPLLLGPVALAAFVGYLWLLTGDPLAAIHAQDPWSTLTPSGGDEAGSATGEAPIVIGAAPAAAVALWLGTLLFYTFLLVFFRVDRITVPYLLWATTAIVSIFLAGRLMSAPRYLAAAWPFDWTLAARSGLARLIVPVVFGVTQCAFAWLAFTWLAPP